MLWNGRFVTDDLCALRVLVLNGQLSSCGQAARSCVTVTGAENFGETTRDVLRSDSSALERDRSGRSAFGQFTKRNLGCRISAPRKMETNDEDNNK